MRCGRALRRMPTLWDRVPRPESTRIGLAGPPPCASARSSAFRRNPRRRMPATTTRSRPCRCSVNRHFIVVGNSPLSPRDRTDPFDHGASVHRDSRHETRAIACNWPLVHDVLMKTPYQHPAPGTAADDASEWGEGSKLRAALARELVFDNRSADVLTTVCRATSRSVVDLDQPDCAGMAPPASKRQGTGACLCTQHRQNGNVSPGFIVHNHLDYHRLDAHGRLPEPEDVDLAVLGACAGRNSQRDRSQECCRCLAQLGGFGGLRLPSD